MLPCGQQWKQGLQRWNGPAKRDGAMTSEILSCPYCNSRISVSAAEAAGPRVRCPRCGDTFPHHTGAVPATVNGAPMPLPPPALQSPGRLSNTAIARLVLSGMAALAVAALIYALG